jgi:hypothetical protein
MAAYLSPYERILSRHRALAGTITIEGLGAYEDRKILQSPLRALAIHVPSWDWDCLEGDVSLFVHRTDSKRGTKILQRYGFAHMISDSSVIDVHALEADAASMVALVLEAASREAIFQGKLAHVKLPALGAALGLSTSDNMFVGRFAHAAFWRGARLAIVRGSYPGIAILECCASNSPIDLECSAYLLAPPGAFTSYGGIQVHVRNRDISDFSTNLDEDTISNAMTLMPSIVVPGSSFQIPGGKINFHMCLESVLASNSNLSHIFSPLNNVSLLPTAKLAMAAEQPAIVRPRWWPPNKI